MDIWNYDPSTGELLSQTRAAIDPTPEGQAAGRYLIPGFATDVAPPKPQAGQAIVFREGKWEHVEDCRGQTWWDAEHSDFWGKATPIVIQRLGDELALKLSRTEPPPTLEQAKFAKSFELRDECVKRMTANFKCDALGEVFIYPNNFTDQHNLIAAIIVGLECPLWCADEHEVWKMRPHNLAQMKTVARLSKEQIMTVQRDYEGMLERLTNETDLGNVTRMAWMRR